MGELLLVPLTLVIIDLNRTIDELVQVAGSRPQDERVAHRVVRTHSEGQDLSTPIQPLRC